MSTLFTKIINKEIPSDIVYEDEKVIAIKDINPQAKIHFLVIPKKEIPTVNDILEEDKELIGHIYLVISKLAKEYKVDASGYRVVVNCNGDGGQEVYHLHYHLIGGEKLGTMV